MCVESFEDKGDDIPRTTSRTEVGSAKASRMNSCGIFGSAAFSILAIQKVPRWKGDVGVNEATRLTGSGCCLVRDLWTMRVLWLTGREAEWMDDDDGLVACSWNAAIAWGDCG